MIISAIARLLCSEPDADRHGPVLARCALNARAVATPRLLPRLCCLGTAVRGSERLEKSLGPRIWRDEWHIRSVSQDEAEITKTHCQMLATDDQGSTSNDTSVRIENRHGIGGVGAGGGGFYAAI